MDKKFAVVTGASAGIGKEVAIELASNGYCVYANARNLEKLSDLLNLAKTNGLCIKPIIFDVSIKEQVSKALSELDYIDCLVNNAGVGTTPIFEDITEEDWDKVLNTNVKGYFYCTKYSISKMKKGGVVINLSSGAAKTGGDFVSLPYSTSKGGINSLTIAFARMLAPKGIRVNAISPGFVNTRMLPLNEKITREYYSTIIPIGRLGEPEDIAKSVVFLASDNASFITGQIIEVNGGDIMG